MKGLERLNVLVQHNPSCKIPIAVLSYELPVLEAIHKSGDEAPTVIVTGSEVVEVDFDAKEAFDNLLRKYNGNTDVVKMVYRDPAELNRSVKFVDLPKQSKAA